MQGPLTLKNKMLSNPLVGLSKASTPVRTRVISNLKNDILNSTPINQLKFTSTISKSPGFNKQNNKNFTNSQLLRSNSKVIFCNTKLNENNNSKQSIIDRVAISSPNLQQGTNKLTKQKKKVTFSNSIYQNREALNFRQVNLSPIMALNRRLNQGPSLKNLRSFTPNAQIKRSDSPFDNSKCLKDSSQSKFPQQNVPRACGILRQSSSLNNLLGSRMKLQQSKDSKPISRLGSMAFSSLNKKINNKFNQLLKFEVMHGMKQSRSMNNVFENGRIQYQTQHPRKALISSKQLKLNNHLQNNTNIMSSALSNSNSMNQTLSKQLHETLMCANNHDKKAKYKITSEESDQIVAYCSKCAIQLVQKGFSVEQLQECTQPRTNSNLIGCSPYNSSFKQKFYAYKSGPSSQSSQLKKLQHIQSIKNCLNRQINILNQRGNSLQLKFSSSIGEVDCYYNSIIAYIQKRKIEDKISIQKFKIQLQRQQFYHQGQPSALRLQQFSTRLQHYSKIKNINSQASNQIQLIQSQLNQYLRQSALKENGENSNIQTELITFKPTIQRQFDQFAQIFDKTLKLNYTQNNSISQIQYNSKSFSQANQCQNQRYQQRRKDKSSNKSNLNTNALRFSFQKALQSQNRSKNYFQSSMKALSEEDFDADQQFEDSSQLIGNAQNQQFVQNQYADHYQKNDKYAQNHAQNQYAQNHAQNQYGKSHEQHQYNQAQLNNKQDQYYEQNSFSHQSFSNYNNCQQNIQKVTTQGSNQMSQPILKQSRQRPFRTLFAEEDQILANFKAQESTNQNNNIYSPTFKVI